MEGRIIRAAKLSSKVKFTTLRNADLDMIGHERCYIYLQLLCCIAGFLSTEIGVNSQGTAGTLDVLLLFINMIIFIFNKRRRNLDAY